MRPDERPLDDDDDEDDEDDEPHEDEGRRPDETVPELLVEGRRPDETVPGICPREPTHELPHVAAEPGRRPDSLVAPEGRWVIDAPDDEGR